MVTATIERKYKTKIQIWGIQKHSHKTRHKKKNMYENIHLQRIRHGRKVLPFEHLQKSVEIIRGLEIRLVLFVDTRRVVNHTVNIKSPILLLASKELVTLSSGVWPVADTRLGTLDADGYCFPVSLYSSVGPRIDRLTKSTPSAVPSVSRSIIL